MRGFALLLIAVLLLFSCATPGEEPVDDVVVIDDGAGGDSASTVAEQPGDADAAQPQDAPGDEPPVVEEPIVEPEPPAPSLSITKPADLSVLTSSEFLFAAGLDSDDGGVPDSIEVELLSGPIVSGGFVLQDLSTIPVEERTLTLRLSDLSAGIALGAGESDDMGAPEDQDALRAAAAISLPPGLVDGEVYSWRARGALPDGGYTPWTEQTNTQLDLGFAPPVAFAQPATIDSTPVLTWQNGDEFVSFRVRLLNAAGEELGAAVSRRGSYEVPQTLTSGRYQFTVSGLRPDGFATRPGDPTAIIVLADAKPRAAWPRRGELTLGSSVGLQWTNVVGAAGYQAQYRVPGGEWVVLPAADDTFVAIPGALEPEQGYEWQVRAKDENGKLFSWSGISSFVVDQMTLQFLPVIQAGETGVLTRGYEAGSRDESPVGEVVLTVPFEMATTPLTNLEVARMVNYALARGFVSADATGVYLDDTPLLGLDVMDYGQQIGLVLQDGVLIVRDGYGEHPAVGITWAGALQLANLLSFVEGRAPAYDVDGQSWNQQSDGYRLPTEAEWEYAARGSTTRLLPWGSALTGRVANYYRSFDPYEDVNEPFDAAGGPTTPARFFNGTANNGFQTANGASPFGILDMVGNTWEWCWDRYAPDYYAVSDSTNPTGPDESDLHVSNQAIVLAVTLDPNQRVVRGTAWNSRAPDVRLTNRGRYTELGRSYSIGVRLVRSPQQ
jgi:formylglycine-generating enzyme required for sulfatase activity